MKTNILILALLRSVSVSACVCLFVFVCFCMCVFVCMLFVCVYSDCTVYSDSKAWETKDSNIFFYEWRK